MIPTKAQAATFEWLLRPPDGILECGWIVYTDGSLLDSDPIILARAGWAFVAVDKDGATRAIARKLTTAMDRHELRSSNVGSVAGTCGLIGLGQTH